MISLGRQLIASMNGKDYEVIRSDVGEYHDGVYVPRKDECVTIFASIQPVTGDDLLRIEEGDRQSNRKKVYSADPLYTSNDESQSTADIIKIDDKNYQVESVERWPNYSKAIVVRVDT